MDKIIYKINSRKRFQNDCDQVERTILTAYNNTYEVEKRYFNYYTKEGKEQEPTPAYVTVITAVENMENLHKLESFVKTSGIDAEITTGILDTEEITGEKPFAYLNITYFQTIEEEERAENYIYYAFVKVLG